MADFVRSREILEMKMQIHNEIGQALLATRAWLQSQEDGGESRLFKQWEAIIALMRAEAEPKQGKTDWEIFCRCAQAAGVEIRLDGKLPGAGRACDLLIAAAAEALTNAVRHAKADSLYVYICREGSMLQVRFCNNESSAKAEDHRGRWAWRTPASGRGGRGQYADPFCPAVCADFVDSGRRGGKQMVRVLIVEDDPMARTLFELYLKHSGRYELAAAIESASMAELYCLKNPVNLIIMDVCTALKASGLTAAAKIKKNSPGIRIVLVTSQPECDFIHRAKEAGIDSFWYKEPLENSLLSVLDRTMAGESVYPEDTPVLKVGEALSTEFTEGELKVLRELTGGDTDEEIANTLNFSIWTVRKYVKIMLEKTGFKSRTQLAVAARESGLVIRGY